MKFDRSNLLDFCYYGEINSQRRIYWPIIKTEEIVFVNKYNAVQFIMLLILYCFKILAKHDIKVQERDELYVFQYRIPIK